MASKRIAPYEQHFAAAVVGGCFIMTTLGTNYCLGGLSPYLVSRLKVGTWNESGSGMDLINTGSIVWVFVAAALFQGVGMLASGFMVARLPCDRRWSILAGCLLSSVGTCLSGVTVCESIGLVILTSGVIFGLGQGLAYALIIESVTSWTEQQKGLATGVLVGSFALGAIIFLPIQSKIINPDNFTPNWKVGTDRLFSQTAVTNRVPYSFFVMSAIYAIVQIAFVSLIRRKRSPSVEKKPGEPCEATMLIALSDEQIVGDKLASGSDDLLSPPQSAGSETQATTVATPWTLKSALASLPFLVMGVSIFFLTPASIVLPTLDKAYGETFISNDMLLSVLAGLASAFNAIGRIVAGAVIDRVSFRACVLALGLLLALLHSLVPLSTATHPVVYFILVCLVHFVFSGIFVFFPFAVESLYGSPLFPQIYGLVFLFKAASGALIATVNTYGLEALGWTGIMLLTASTSVVGGLTILLYNTNRWRFSVSFL